MVIASEGEAVSGKLINSQLHNDEDVEEFLSTNVEAHQLFKFDRVINDSYSKSLYSAVVKP